MRYFTVKLVILIAVVFACMSMVVHDFHLSKSTINIDTESSTLQITSHIYIDDLEVALAEKQYPKLYIGTEKEDSTSDVYIEKYLNDHFQLLYEGDTLSHYFLGKELSQDLAAIWCYMEVPMTTLDGKLQIANTVLMEIFDDQKNLISIKKDKKRYKDFILERDDYEVKVSL